MVLRKGALRLNQRKENIMNTDNRTSFIALLNDLVSGIQKNQPNGSFSLGGTTFTASQVVDFLQSIVDANVALQSAHGEFLDASSAFQALVIKYQPLVTDLKQSLQIQAGDSVAVLADYGLKPRKPKGHRSPAAQVAAAQKGALTRVARGTKGPKAKLKITGATAPAEAVQASAPQASTNGVVAPATPPGAQTSVKPAI
jgi:hypothetical protein